MDDHISIQMHKLIIYHISSIIQVILYFTSCSCNYVLSSHSNVMLLISYHIFYTFHLHILVIFFLGFMSANTLEADMRYNCMYLKVLSLYETVISICIYPKVSSLYETVTYAM